MSGSVAGVLGRCPPPPLRGVAGTRPPRGVGKTPPDVGGRGGCPEGVDLPLIALPGLLLASLGGEGVAACGALCDALPRFEAEASA